MNIYIGNFAYDITEEDLKKTFAAYGRIEDVKIIKDKYTGQSRGFGFVTMPDKGEAQEALKGVKVIKGKKITINEARPQAVSSLRGPKGSFGGYGGRKKNTSFGPY